MPRRKRKRNMEEQWAHERATWKKQERAWRKQDEAWAREDRRIQRQIAPMKFDSDSDEDTPDEELDEEELLRRYPEGVTIIKNGVEITIRPHDQGDDEFQWLEKGWLLNIFFPGRKHPAAKWGDRISALIALAVSLAPLLLLMIQNGAPFDKAISTYGMSVIDFITRHFMGEVGGMLSILAIALTVPLMLPGPLAIIAAFILIFAAIRYPMWILILLLGTLRRGVLMIVRRLFRRRAEREPETVDLSDPIQRQLAERRRKLRVKA